MTALPVSRHDVGRFEPEGETGPVYLLATPTVLQRAAWRRDVAALGARYPSDDEVYRALIADLSDAKPADLADLVATVEAVRDTPVEDRDPATVEKFALICAAARRAGGQFAKAEADRAFWAAVAPIAAARLFVVGWERMAVAFARDLVDELPEAHVQAVGWACIERMRLAEDARKNSVSPSPSP